MMVRLANTSEGGPAGDNQRDTTRRERLRDDRTVAGTHKRLIPAAAPVRPASRGKTEKAKARALARSPAPGYQHIMNAFIKGSGHSLRCLAKLCMLNSTVVSEIVLLYIKAVCDSFLGLPYE